MNLIKKAVFSTAYFPPVQYFSKISNCEFVYIEKNENFIKQTFRNRCNILSANGLLPLSIPVNRNEKMKIRITDLKIDYSTIWQKIHFKSIESAYKSSPFYDYYIDEFLPFFKKKYTFLYDFNLEIINVIFKNVNQDIKIIETEDFINIGDKNFTDFRYSISPKIKKNYPEISDLKYHQVFGEKFGFVTDLSILDLLFNLGPETSEYLNKFYRLYD